MQLEQQEVDDLEHINLSELVDILDVNVLKDLYKDIHVGLDDVKVKTRLSAKRQFSHN